MSGVSFVSEAQLDEIRLKRQEEWEKVRKADDPLERPEEVRDNKTLFERLEEQKQKKQEEWDEQHKLKNMIRGLDSDETVFLDLVSKQQEELLSRRFNEETQEIKEYRNAVSHLQNAVPSVASTESKSLASAAPKRKPSIESAKKSQVQLVAGAIKRKGSFSQSSPEKKSRSSEDASEEYTVDIRDSLSEEDKVSKKNSEDKQLIKSGCLEEIPPRQGKISATGIPGLGAYSDSSDSESSSSESDTLATHSLFKL